MAYEYRAVLGTRTIVFNTFPQEEFFVFVNSVQVDEREISSIDLMQLVVVLRH